MSTITFDTLKYTKTLENAGVPQAQAEAMAQAQSAAMAEATENALATKRDIGEIHYELKLIKWMVGASIALSAGTLSLAARIVITH